MSGYWVAAVLSLWLLLVVVGVAQLGLLRRFGPLLDGGHGRPLLSAGLAVGEQVGRFEAVDRSGAPAGREALLGRPVLVLLSSAGCEPCERLAAELHTSMHPWPDGSLVVILDGEDDLGLPSWVRVLHQRDGSAAEAFDTNATPYAFALDSTGVVTASAIPASVDQLWELHRDSGTAATSTEVSDQPRKEVQRR